MKQFVILSIIFSLALFSGCTKKAETEKVDLDTDDALEETLTNAMEDPSMALQQLPQISTSSDMITAQIQPSPTVAIPENPTSQQIQQALKNAGLYDGSVDGVVGSKTKKAIEEFQAQNNLSTDGKVGSKTWAALGPYLNGSSNPASAETTTPAAIQ